MTQAIKDMEARQRLERIKALHAKLQTPESVAEHSGQQLTGASGTSAGAQLEEIVFEP